MNRPIGELALQQAFYWQRVSGAAGAAVRGGAGDSGGAPVLRARAVVFRHSKRRLLLQ